MTFTGSFRDPSGYVYRKKQKLFRKINNIYKEDYKTLINSGLYNELIYQKLLIPHKEINLQSEIDQNTYKTIEPELVKYISYPFEWCFSQLKDAALQTLRIETIALEKGMTLK